MLSLYLESKSIFYVKFIEKISKISITRQL